MKCITKILLASFIGATVVTGIVAGIAISVLSEQTRTVQVQNNPQNPNVIIMLVQILNKTIPKPIMT